MDQLGLAGAGRPGFPKMPQQPGGPQINGMHPPATAGVTRFLLPVSDCECTLSTVRNCVHGHLISGFSVQGSISFCSFAAAGRVAA